MNTPNSIYNFHSFSYHNLIFPNSFGTVVKKQKANFLDNIGLCWPYQSRFRARHSTNSAFDSVRIIRSCWTNCLSIFHFPASASSPIKAIYPKGHFGVLIGYCVPDAAYVNGHKGSNNIWVSTVDIEICT